MIGFWVGNETLEEVEYHVMGVGNIGFAWEGRMYTTDDTGWHQMSSRLEYPAALWANEEPFVLGFELKAGVYTLYLNDQPLLDAEIEPYGNTVGLSVISEGGIDDVYFDNLIVRSAK
jgi:hypothetical protein